MPRYWDACRTFITSRDSLTRNAHLILHKPLSCQDFAAPNFLAELQDTETPGAARGTVMASACCERQGILSRSCPKNAGNLRQIAWYCRQVGPVIVLVFADTHNQLCFFKNSGLSESTVILSSQFAREVTRSLARQLQEPSDMFLGDNGRIWRQVHDMKAVYYDSAHGRTYAKSFAYEFGNGLSYCYFATGRKFLKSGHQIMIHLYGHFHGELSPSLELFSRKPFKSRGFSRWLRRGLWFFRRQAFHRATGGKSLRWPICAWRQCPFWSRNPAFERRDPGCRPGPE
jgi:hypothetical protein